MPNAPIRRISASLSLALISLLATNAALSQQPKKPAPGAANAASAQPKPSLITIGREVSISGADSLSAYSEYSADIDPDHPERLIACTQPWVPTLNERKNIFHVSFDGGTTWAVALEDKASRGGLLAGDPMCNFALNNVAILSSDVTHDTVGFGRLSGTWEGWPGGIGQRIFRSTDGGRSWAKPYEIEFVDNQNILVDRTGGRFNGRIYIHGNASGDPFWLVYSADSGKSFVRGEVLHVEGTKWSQFDRGTILLDGTVLLPYKASDKRNADTPDAPKMLTYGVSRSTDGGVHMSKPDTVASARPECEALSLPQMETDRSRGPFRGRAYYLWMEMDRGIGSGRDAGKVASRCIQVISTSDDGGKTWSMPVQVSDLPFHGSAQPGPDTRLAALAVNASGVVGVTWYDRREDPKNRSARLRFSASLDGGDSWLPSVGVSKMLAVDGPRGLSVHAAVTGGGREPNGRGGEGGGGGGRGAAQQPTDMIQTPLGPGARQTLDFMAGDYSVLLANPNGSFHAFWVDNRGDAAKPTQLYTTTVNVGGTVQRNGSAELAALDNVTRKVAVQYQSANSNWEGDYLNLSLGVVLLNVSRDTVVGPLKYRILGVHSPLGPVIVRDTRADAAGSVFDLTGALPAGGLAPGKTTTIYEIKLRIGPVPRDIADGGYQAMGSFDAKIFGKVHAGAARAER